MSVKTVSRVVNRWQTGALALVLVVGLGSPFGVPSAVAAPASDQARVLMQLLPGQVYTGERFNVVIQVKNLSRNTWTAAAGYHLAALAPAAWQRQRLELDGPVAPGEVAVFEARFTAPEAAGEYRLQWQMRQDGRDIGAAAPAVELLVSERVLSRDDAEFVFQDVSETMLVGETHGVAIQFKNTSPTAWRSGQVALASPPDEGLLWAVDSVDMEPGEVVQPGEFVVFRFHVQAPLEPGHYPFQWQLQHVRDGLFGQPSEGLIIDVR